MQGLSLTDLLSSLHPRLTLDVGCGCGEFARSLASHCDGLVCMDISTSLRSRWSLPPAGGRPGHGGGLRFCCMDARRMGFPPASFPVVFERASLHHVAEWEAVMDEMFRVSGAHVLLEEPVDDPRSVAKRNTIRAQDLFLDLQREIGISHFRHLDPAIVLAAVARRGIVRRSEIVRSDEPVPADEYFQPFSRLAAQSRRPQFWESRRTALLKELDGGPLCENDSLVVLAEVSSKPL